MAGSEDDLDLSSAQIEDLTIGEVAGLPLEGHREHFFVGRMNPDGIPFADGTDMISMAVGDDKRNGLLDDVLYGLAQPFDVRSGINEDGRGLSLNQINRFVIHEVAMTMPGMGVELADFYLIAVQKGGRIVQINTQSGQCEDCKDDNSDNDLFHCNEFVSNVFKFDFLNVLLL